MTKRRDELAGDGYLIYSAAIPNSWTQATLVLRSSSNSTAAAERYDFDSIEFRGLGTPSLPGDLDDDGTVGLANLAPM